MPITALLLLVVATAPVEPPPPQDRDPSAGVEAAESPARNNRRRAAEKRAYDEGRAGVILAAAVGGGAVGLTLGVVAGRALALPLFASFLAPVGILVFLSVAALATAVGIATGIIVAVVAYPPFKPREGSAARGADEPPVRRAAHAA